MCVTTLQLRKLQKKKNRLFTRHYGSITFKSQYLFIKKYFFRILLLLAGDIEVCPGPTARITCYGRA